MRGSRRYDTRCRRFKFTNSISRWQWCSFPLQFVEIKNVAGHGFLILLCQLGTPNLDRGARCAMTVDDRRTVTIDDGRRYLRYLLRRLPVFLYPLLGIMKPFSDMGPRMTSEIFGQPTCAVAAIG